MEFATAKELWEKGNIGDTVLIDGQTWIKTGEGIGDILMPFDESALPRSTPDPIVKAYIVWNHTKTEGFVTFDEQLAYEVRKGAYTNCYTADGSPSPVAEAFAMEHGTYDCTIREIEIAD